MTLAVSTSWNAFRFDDGEKLLFEINELGFRAIELSFNLNAEMIGAIARSARDLRINITSLHNYCPVPDGLSRKQALPDCYSLSSLSEEERLLAVKYTKRTIDTAADLGARAVVLHCGRVEAPDFTRQLIGLYDQGRIDSEESSALKNKMFRVRSSQSEKFINQALLSLEELDVYAGSKGILLGVETRFYYREIPNIEEIGIILNNFEGSQIFYWHDTGHAQLMENLGFLKHQDFLERYGRKMIGIHLHDILGCRDHLAPAEGELDFAMLKPYMGKSIIKVIEAHHPAAAESLIRSRNFISKIYDEPA